MFSTIAALALFAAIAGGSRLNRRQSAPEAPHVDAPSALPEPGVRDLYAVSNGTLVQARVPSWV